MSLVLDEHRQYLSDGPRLDAFRRAIAAAIRPGDVVLDLGSGTGILGYLACQAGASRVYAIDEGPIVGVARDIVRTNGLEERVRVIRQVSTWTELPEPVDAIVTDQIGQVGFDAGVVQYVADARARLLKPGGRIVPGAIDIHVAPCDDASVRAAVEFWNEPIAGLDWSAVRPLAACTGYPRRLTDQSLLADGRPVFRIDLATASGERLEGEASSEVTRSGTMEAVAAWFVAELAPGIRMTNAPGDAHRIDRRLAVLPIDRPVPVRAGDRVGITLRARPTETVLDWQVVVRGADGAERARFRHSTFGGMLIAAEDLARTSPDRVPALSAVGRARRSVLDLCDGQRSVAAIEREVRARHPELFPSDAAAAMFVAEVLTRYAE
ncbi:MAG: 50S ribosomal protein L11 methyltransferase [Vicinamibacterales bacterium]